MFSLTIRRPEPRLRRVLHEYAAIGFDPRRRARTVHLTQTRSRQLMVAAAGLITIAVGAALSIRSEYAIGLASLLAAGAISVIVSVVQSRSLHGGMVTVQDMILLTLHLGLTGLAAASSGSALVNIGGLRRGLLDAGGLDAYFTLVQFAALGVVLAIVASYLAPPLLSRRVVRAPLLLNTLSILVVWGCSAVASVVVLGPVVAAVGKPVTAITVSISALVFLVGIGALRLRQLHGTCEELASALDEYLVELTATRPDREAERRSYLRVERTALTRTFGSLFPAFRGRTDRATRMGLLFVGSAVTGIDTVLRDVHADRVRRDLGGDSGELRRQAAAFVRDLRSALVPRS